MESKFKVGDRVELVTDGGYVGDAFYPGALGTVAMCTLSGVNVRVDGDGFELYFNNTELSHYDQTLQDLNVKVGDVVECVAACTTEFTERKRYMCHKDGCIKYDDGNDVSVTVSLFRIISRASDNQWTPCEPDYTHQDNHEVSYHMGVPTHWREVVAKEVDVERRVEWNGEYHAQGPSNTPNATLRGKTLNGKPVGQWVIDMDAV